jgi:STE24 endopeptidase
MPRVGRIFGAACVLATLSLQAKGIDRIEKNGRWGWAVDGQVLVQPRFVDYPEFSEGLSPASEEGGEDGHYGYVRLDGTWAVPPAFTNARDFSFGRAAVETERGWGMIDAQGRWIIPARWDEMGDLKDGRVWASRKGAATVFDRDGKALPWGPLDWVSDFKGGWAMAVRDRHWFALSAENERSPVPDIDEAQGFCNGYAAARKDGRWGFVDDEGNWKVPPSFEALGDFSGTQAAAQMNGRWGVIDANGHWAFQPLFDSVDCDPDSVYAELGGWRSSLPWGSYRSYSGKAWTWVWITAALIVGAGLLQYGRDRWFLRRPIPAEREARASALFKHVQGSGLILWAALGLWMALLLIPHLDGPLEALAAVALSAGAAWSPPWAVPLLLNGAKALQYTGFLVALFAALMAARWPLAEAYHQRGWTLASYTLEQGRLILFLGMGWLLAALGLFSLIGWRWGAPLGAGLGMALGSVLAVPLGSKLLNAGPLPDGALRRRLQRFLAKAGFSLEDVRLVSHAEHGSANALAVGLWPGPRRVFLTRRLVARFKPAELEAVLGHEIGHHRLGHLWVRTLLYTALLVLLSEAGYTALASAQSPWTIALFYLGGSFLILLALNRIGRRQELAADAVAAELCGGGASMRRALERLHDDNLIPRRWAKGKGMLMSHPSLDERSRGVAAPKNRGRAGRAAGRR